MSYIILIDDCDEQKMTFTGQSFPTLEEAEKFSKDYVTDSTNHFSNEKLYIVEIQSIVKAERTVDIQRKDKYIK